MKHLVAFMACSVLISACKSGSGGDQQTFVSYPDIITVRRHPVFPGEPGNELIMLSVPVGESPEPGLSVNRMDVNFERGSDTKSLSMIEILYRGVEGGISEIEKFGQISDPGVLNRIAGKTLLGKGNNIFVVSFKTKPDIDLLGKLWIKNVRMIFSDGSVRKIVPHPGTDPFRYGLILRRAGDDGSDTYRIPGLATTTEGTLLAVYDVRYNNSKDLQEDIDVGMSRSTDGGQTWEPMKIIMDMDGWGNRPEEENGAGDPCILVDELRGTVWVAGLWLHGFPGTAAWNSSGPGLDPEETGQLLIVKSDDDGISWSDEINITAQVKDPDWRLLLQGPGKGITLHDGTLVFPAQYKDAAGIPFSTIIWSDDGGKSWHSGTGAKENTTEAQCVQLSNGDIMLNMRDNRNSTIKDENNGRAVAITRDLGKTWESHPSSNSALPEPVCMASLISADIEISGKKHKILLFSNPADKHTRSKMTIKASIDEGLNWPGKYQLELNQEEGFGYSCLAMIDENTVGILYEGEKDLFFQKIPLKDIIGDLK